MKWLNRLGRPLPDALTRQPRTIGRDPVNRREFLTLASSFGASTATAYAMLGLPSPAPAQTAPGAGRDGTLRIQMLVRPLRDPRRYNWFQTANFSRGWLEYLVSYENNGSFRPQLLKAWEISDDATRYTLYLRPGVTWNNGDPFTAADVARNIVGWCDRTVPGNSMAGRFQVLVDPGTGQAIKGAIRTPDALTVTLQLPRPDISLIAGMADYPAAIVPAGFDADTMFENPVGTGPYLPESHAAGQRAVLVRNPDHTWWNAGNGAWMQRIEFIDTGTDPASALDAALRGEIDMTHTSEGNAIDAFDTLEDWNRNAVDTAATVVIRANQQAEINGRRPYGDHRVRRALQLAMDNAIILELGHGNRGEVAENHHVSPLHPEYAPLPPQPFDPSAARGLMTAAGMLDFEHELISLDDAWRRDTADAAAALMLDAGLKVRRTVIPGALYWESWANFPFSTTDWGHRPLGVQTYALAYRSGEPWNEFGWTNSEFDALLQQALGTLDIEKRRQIMARCEKLVQGDAVTVQPYWRTLYNHTRAGLEGGGQHIALEIRPAELRWR